MNQCAQAHAPGSGMHATLCQKHVPFLLHSVPRMRSDLLPSIAPSMQAVAHQHIRSSPAHPAGVQVERLPLLVQVQNLLEVTVRKEDAPPQERMHRLAGQALHSAQIGRVGA